MGAKEIFIKIVTWLNKKPDIQNRPSEKVNLDNTLTDKEYDFLMNRGYELSGQEIINWEFKPKKKNGKLYIVEKVPEKLYTKGKRKYCNVWHEIKR